MISTPKITFQVQTPGMNDFVREMIDAQFRWQLRKLRVIGFMAHTTHM